MKKMRKLEWVGKFVLIILAIPFLARAGAGLDIHGVADGGIYNYDVTPTIDAIGYSPDATWIIKLDGSTYEGDLSKTYDSKEFPLIKYWWTFTGSPISAEGSHTLAASFNDNGNIDTKIVNFVIDKTHPTITASAYTSDGLPYTPGTWTNKDVTVSFSCSDDIYGIASCSNPVTLSGDGADQSVTGTATNNAGNQAHVTFSGINIDKTPPTITASASTSDGSSYTSGKWTNKDVTVSFSCSDEKSGVASCNSPITLSTEGSGQSVTGTVTDNAGNQASVTFSGINIDKTPPVIIITIDSQRTNEYGGIFLHSKSTATLLITDALSGVEYQSDPNGNYDLDTSYVGYHQFTITAKDRAGNLASYDGVYHVSYKGTTKPEITSAELQRLKMFLPPLEQVSDPSSLTKYFKSGSTLPLKFQLFDANNIPVGTAKTSLTLYKVQNSIDMSDQLVDLGTTSNDNSNVFRYDTIDQQYIYNLGTKGFSGTYKIVTALDDDTSVETFIQLR